MDKPYTERTGGSYVRDPETGERKLVEATTPAPDGQGGKPTGRAAPIKAEKKGK